MVWYRIAVVGLVEVVGYPLPVVARLVSRVQDVAARVTARRSRRILPIPIPVMRILTLVSVSVVVARPLPIA